MKVKELDKTVNLAWSPSNLSPVMLAAGTAAQQLDASFSTSASLDIYELNLDEPGLDMGLRSSIQSQNRFHKIVWGGYSNGEQGVIVGGCDNGRLQMYNASRVLAGDDGLLCSPERHTGPVKAIDFNSFQSNLLSTGASESEIYIWDLNNVKTPMTPGAKSQPAEEVVWLAWNRQVQHILASTFATRCVVWDLRKNEPIIKLSDSNSRVRWKVVAWHPDVATQLCLASEEDSNPVIQLWDLRFATSPIKTLEGHQKGVLSIAWCAQDPDLLVSCGKDSRILCWNPAATHQTEEIVCEMVTGNQWNFEISWCPRNPSLIATSSFDGHASVFSLVGGQSQMQTTNKIADSFPGMEQYAEAPVVQPPHHAHVAVDLRKAPKWLKRPVGASFGFGGKLVSFSSEGQAVNVSQVITEQVLIERSHRLQQVLGNGQLKDICHSKSDPVWTFVAASLEPDYRTAMRTLLGFTQEQLELNKYIGQPVNSKLNDIDGLTEDFSLISQDGSDEEGRLNNSFGGKQFNAVQNNTHLFNSSRSEDSSFDSKSPFKIRTGEDKEGVICRALLAGNIELAVDLCVQENRMTDAIILAYTAGPDILARTQYKYFQQSQCYLSYLLNAVVTKDWSQVVSCCDLGSWAEALAAILTYASDDQVPALCERLGDRLEREGGPDSRKNSEICFIAAGQLNHLIQNRIASDLSIEALQEMVELVLVASRGETGGSNTAHLLDRYAQLLASQGDLITALAYLSTSQQEDIEELRERLYIASGQKPYPTPHNQQNHYYQNSQQKYPANYSKPINQQTKTVQNSIFQQPPMTATTAFPPANQSYGSANQHFPSTNQTFAPPSITPPRRPSISNPLVSSFQSSSPANNFPPPTSALQTNSFPPTLSNQMSSNAFSSSQPLFPSQPQTQPVNVFTPASSAFAPPPTQKPFIPATSLPPQPPPTSRTPLHFNSDTVAPPPSAAAPPPTFSHRSSPSPSLGGNSRSKYLVDPSVGGGLTYRSSSVTSFNSNLYAPQPQTFGQSASLGYNAAPTAAPYTQPGPTSYNAFNPPGAPVPPPVTNQPEHRMNHFVPQTTPAAPGWNDPPSLSANTRPKLAGGCMSAEHAGTRRWGSMLAHAKKDVQPAPPPITHPLFGAAPQQEMIPLHGGPPIPIQQQQPMQPSSLGYGGMEPQTQQSYNYPGQGQGMMPQQPQPPVAAPAPVAKVAEPPRPKPPLPEEHMHLQTVFDELRNRCTCAASNPQLRRKLEDVARKLELLYDTIRENKISGGTLKSLHQLVQLMQRGDYTNALHLHTQILSGTDFSQVSSFMPGLKVLIQSALQLNIYLQ